MVLGTIPLAVIVRMTRSSCWKCWAKIAYRAARAKELTIIARHHGPALRNAMLPVVAVI